MEVSGQLHAPADLPSGKEPHWIGGLAGSSVSLDAVEKREILHFRQSNQSLPARSPSLHHSIIPILSGEEYK
jgi:hypothetical protein